MSEIIRFIAELREQGVHLWAEGNRLQYGTNSRPLSAAEMDRLRAHKEEILSLLTIADGAASEAPLPIIEERNKPLVLSFAQQRLWFLMQMEGANEAYNIPLGLRLKGDLNQVALRSALDRLVERHETLRTRFETVCGETFQRIDPPDVGFSLLFQDLGGGADGEHQLAAVITEELATPFDLERGPVARGRLIRAGAHDHVLLITLHHINSDGWSLAVLARDLSAFYESCMREQRSPLEPLSFQYADFAAWQRRALSGESLTEHSAYWRRVLEGVPTALELPTDYKRPAQQRFEGHVLPVEFDEELTSRLKALSRRYGMTLFMTVLAGWALVLSRLSGEDDLVIGTPTANRTRAEIESLIGLFVNTLALRIDLSGDPTVEELLLRSRTTVLEAQEHQDLPFEQVVELVNPVRSAAHTPLFQVMLAWQNNEIENFKFSGLQVSRLATPLTTAKYDLTLDLAESDGRIVGVLNYSAALFELETAQRHVEYLRRALSMMSTDVAQRVATVDILPPAERHLLLEKWSGRSAEFPQDRCVHELVESQVQRSPSATAVVGERASLSYVELNRRANKLARYLRASGVGPDELVAICVERGVDMVVGMLGVLKAGGAYVPLDPAYPAKRLAYMLKDAAPRVLLTEERHRELLPAVVSDVIAIDSDWDTIAEYEDTNLPVGELGLTPRHLAYVIYTSGSTGEPKGAMNEHRGMVNRIMAQSDIEAFTEGDICC